MEVTIKDFEHFINKTTICSSNDNRILIVSVLMERSKILSAFWVEKRIKDTNDYKIIKKTELLTEAIDAYNTIQ